MKKVLLDFSVPQTQEKTQEYLAEKMGFPDYYGKNLDALYDELTSIGEPTAVGIFLPVSDLIDLDIDLMVYFDQIGEVFSDAEADNPNLAVIYGDLVMNPEFEDLYDPEDEYLMDEEDEDEDEDADPDSGYAMPGDKDILFLDIGKKRS